ncbi:photosystem II complex extrinsic protein PsbU [Cyanobacterium stanieri LEGE 03274]|uniref:Photosystem II extrinsic protein U n=1 Tax=Cyanobacterium stanieri LEGE 03274 TaxID=1828756 RepID=A0ABR9V707_9CHRO|nr:photosystem II complex extrinsic protein PsbU [Cyanobacterium stanieri]MBE9223690.1 photosystem II complex extrinsic protein PsbU [Cyanobacterium stanieri LEGE 03274]
MKLWQRISAYFSVLVVGCVMLFAQPAQAYTFNDISQLSPRIVAVEGDRRNVADDLLTTEFGQKIDVNNSDIRDFRELRGFYPKLASIIIQNAPYEQVEDVLTIPGLSERQKERLQANLDRFSATPPAAVFNEGDERYNAGVY